MEQSLFVRRNGIYNAGGGQIYLLLLTLYEKEFNFAKAATEEGQIRFPIRIFSTLPLCHVSCSVFNV